MNQNDHARRRFLRNLGITLGAGGASALLPQLQLIRAAAAEDYAVEGYRALVCVYLSGGNDSWNMLMPYDAARHATYAAARGGVHSPSNSAGLAIDRGRMGAPVRIGDAATGAEYALNPGSEEYPEGMGRLAALYRANKLAFVANVGPLVRPMSKAQFVNGDVPKPPNLYAHDSQERLWHLATANDASYGWGGLVADRVGIENGYAALSPSIALDRNLFGTGNDTRPYGLNARGLGALSGVSPVASTSSDGARARALDRLLAEQQTTSPLGQQFAHTFQRARQLYTVLDAALASSTVATEFPDDRLGSKLKMIARTIRASRNPSGTLRHKRQVYFLRFGSFDMHDGLMLPGPDGHAAHMHQLSVALDAFWRSLGEFGAQNEVTLFTMSEFARTMNSNGDGSDHAWGGVQLVMGGAVNGGRLYGSFPAQQLNGPVSLSRGQFIPSVSVDQMAATLARWMGVTSAAELNTIFPNLANFPTANLGFMNA
ncbi:uncharacterized protein (DUF1501 family) [Tahibacter aquaticus]|uniref:Uncharacterized protein (DUF1501 family) n=1 Tax=Tahibacter aquaticus TaxID=520092 RepID=A0A4R6YU62_9GAMM|nr:DUF1501 domain-containing protein [Tahibacter aquaticus]TDR41993.1 uncharacterized protein (DUF1501 family) [Tahibacter aquaticus]